MEEAHISLFLIGWFGLPRLCVSLCELMRLQDVLLDVYSETSIMRTPLVPSKVS